MDYCPNCQGVLEVINIIIDHLSGATSYLLECQDCGRDWRV